VIFVLFPLFVGLWLCDCSDKWVRETEANQAWCSAWTMAFSRYLHDLHFHL